MEDLVKRECIKVMIDQGLEESASILKNIGLDAPSIDEIDKTILVNRMYEVCESSGKEIEFCEEFLKSEIYIRYCDSIKKMTGVIFEKMEEMMGGNTIH